MKISAISDVHIKRPHDEADKLLLSFLTHPKVKNSDYIVLLGDIFDLMVGPHEEYERLYDHLFKALDDLVKAGKTVLYFEGNHDVHLEKLFKGHWPNGEILVTQKPLVKELDGKSYYFSHGDEHEVNNHAYHRYMRFIRSKPLKFVADYIMPYAVLNFVGERASKISRKKGSHKFDAEAVRTKFQNGVIETTGNQYDFILGGHSHVQDQHLFPGTSSTYLNNGYALRTQTFIYIEDHHPSFEKLS